MDGFRYFYQTNWLDRRRRFSLCEREVSCDLGGGVWFGLMRVSDIYWTGLDPDRWAFLAADMSRQPRPEYAVYDVWYMSVLAGDRGSGRLALYDTEGPDGRRFPETGGLKTAVSTGKTVYADPSDAAAELRRTAWEVLSREFPADRADDMFARLDLELATDGW